MCAPSDVCEPGRVGHDFSKVAIHRHGPERIQAKLVVSEPGDAYEREADRIADTVMRMPGPATSSGDDAPAASATTQSVLRARRAVETDATVGTRRVSPPGTLAISRVFDGEREAIGRMGAPGRLRARIGARRGRGKPLAESARSFLEPRFGRELGHLRIHADSEADSLSRSLKARAFTVGRDIFFREGEYRPATERGRRLLAHEVTHTLQQYPVPAMTSISATASSVPVHPESSTPNEGAMPRVARHGTAGTDTAIAGELDRVPTRVFRSAVATWEAASEDDRESILIGETQKEDVRSRDIWKAKRRLRRYRRQQKRREAVASLKNKEHLSRKDKRKLQNKKAYLKWANAWGLTVESPRVDKILTIHANYHYFETFNVGGAAVRIDEGILDDVARMFRIGETPDFWPGIRWTDSSGKEREIGVRFDLGFIPKKPSGDAPAVNAQQFPTELMQDESVQKGKAENVLAAIPIDELYTRDDLEQIWAFLDDEGMTDSFSLETRTAYTLGADPEQVDFERLKAKLLKDIDTRPDPKSQRSDLKKAVEASTSFDTLMDALTSPHEIELSEVGMSDTEIIAYTTPDGERREFDETQLNALKEAIRAEWRRQGRSMETLEGDVAGYGGRKTVGVDWERTQRAKQHPRYQKLSEDELMEKNLSSSQVATYYDNTRQIPQELVTIPSESAPSPRGRNRPRDRPQHRHGTCRPGHHGCRAGAAWRPEGSQTQSREPQYKCILGPPKARQRSRGSERQRSDPRKHPASRESHPGNDTRREVGRCLAGKDPSIAQACRERHSECHGDAVFRPDLAHVAASARAGHTAFVVDRYPSHQRDHRRWSGTRLLGLGKAQRANAKMDTGSDAGCVRR